MSLIIIIIIINAPITAVIVDYDQILRCVFFCSSFAPENFIRSLEIDTSDQQVRCVITFVSLLC